MLRDEPVEPGSLPGEGVEAAHLVSEADLRSQPQDVHRQAIYKVQTVRVGQTNLLCKI